MLILFVTLQHYLFLVTFDVNFCSPHYDANLCSSHCNFDFCLFNYNVNIYLSHCNDNFFYHICVYQQHLLMLSHFDFCLNHYCQTLKVEHPCAPQATLWWQLRWGTHHKKSNRVKFESFLPKIENCSPLCKWGTMRWVKHWVGFLHDEHPYDATSQEEHAQGMHLYHMTWHNAT